MQNKIKDELKGLGIEELGKIHYQLRPSELVEHTIKRKEGKLSSTGALVCNTGKFTGRSPKDKYIVDGFNGLDSIWWGEVNKIVPLNTYNELYRKSMHYMQNKELYVQDAYAGQDDHFKLNLRIITESPWQSLFTYNMFGRIGLKETSSFTPDWHIIAIPDFEAENSSLWSGNKNFTIINFSKKIILIGGSAYTGEIKKGVFTILNYILPQEHKILSMHCSANTDQNDNTAIFFGLSGTGKTTLSADESRMLIGDDEHGWDDTGVFNFEGGCYAKCINLSKEGEPQIYNAIKFGSLLENVLFLNDSRIVNYEDTSITENTRVSYPIHYINNFEPSSTGKHPKNIFFLTCDAFGVLPPISKLSKEQAMYHFISGYTAKIAGTEEGIVEPQTTFSACFGEPFLPLHPVKYAQLFGKKMEQHDVNVWLINTGWSGGGYGVGKRIKLAFTRRIIDAVFKGELESAFYIKEPFFGLQVPSAINGMPDAFLLPQDSWSDPTQYEEKAIYLADQFKSNFKKYQDMADPTILEGEPVQSNPNVI